MKSLPGCRGKLRVYTRSESRRDAVNVGDDRHHPTQHVPPPLPESQSMHPGRELSTHGHLLGQLPFATATALQDRLIYECGNEREPRATILLCEHDPLVTVGRQGSRLHLRADDEELARRGLEVRWVKRGGGAIVHAPGQLAAYAVVPLAHFGLAAGDVVERWQTALEQTADDVGFKRTARSDRLGLFGRGGQAAFVGLAVKQNVAHFGAYVNVAPPESLIHVATGDPRDGVEPTTLAAEMRRPVRMPTIRRVLLERLSTALGCERYHVFTGHPYLPHYLAPSREAARVDQSADR